MIVKAYPDYLSHHGIKGQKWGVRRYQNSDGSLTAEGKKRYYVNGKLDASSYMELTKQKRSSLEKAANTARNTRSIPVVGAINDIKWTNASRAYRKTNAEFDKSSVLIKSGSKVDRVTTGIDEDKLKRLYVSVHGDPNATVYYNHTWPQYLKAFSNNPDTKVYRNLYKVKTDIIAPSEEVRQDIIHTLIMADKKTKTEIGKEYSLSLFRGDYGDNSIKKVSDVVKRFENRQTYDWNEKKFVKKYATKSEAEKAVKEIIKADTERISDKGLTKEYRSRMFYSAIPTSPKLMNMYVKELKKAGYNAVFDENAGSSSVAPFIVFDPKVLEKISEKDISDYDL